MEKFSSELDCDSSNLMKILTDYTNLFKYLPRQLKKIDILEEDETSSIIESTLSFKTLIKKEIIQRVKIERRSNHSLFFQVLDGHAKDTKIRLVVIPKTGKSIVNIEIDLKLSLKTKILSPIIKREYKTLLTGVLRKMENHAKENLEVM